jgi:hypothetical protein
MHSCHRTPSAYHHAYNAGFDGVGPMRVHESSLCWTFSLGAWPNPAAAQQDITSRLSHVRHDTCSHMTFHSMRSFGAKLVARNLDVQSLTTQAWMAAEADDC